MNYVSVALGAAFCLAVTSCASVVSTAYPTVCQAAAAGDANDVALHIAKHRPLDVRADSGATALHIAALRNDTTIIGLLLRAGLGPNIADSVGRLPLGYAAARGNTLAASLLLRAGSEILLGEANAYAVAVASNNAAFVDTLLKYGADPNADFGLRGNPLEWAILNDAEHVIRLLLSKGVNIMQRTSDGSTPLHLAAEAYRTKETQPRTVETLLELGADPNAQDSLGRTPLHIAVLYGYPETVEALVRHGANPLAKAADGLTPTDLARQRADQGETRFLSYLRSLSPNS